MKSEIRIGIRCIDILLEAASITVLWIYKLQNMKYCSSEAFRIRDTQPVV